MDKACFRGSLSPYAMPLWMAHDALLTWSSPCAAIHCAPVSHETPNKLLGYRPEPAA